MVLATTAAVTAIIVTGGAATPAVVAAATEGIACGVAGSAAVVSGATTGVAVAGATGSAAVAGAITGAVAGGGTAASALTGASIAATSAAGVAASGGGAATAASVGLLAGPVGWICLGAESNDGNDERQRLTFDCWKPLLRDNSTRPSKGMLLRDVLLDPRIKNVEVSSTISETYPQIHLQNIWGDHFEIVYVRLPWNEIAAHAVPL